MVNQVMQTASTMASLGLSAGLPSSSTMPTEGMVLTVMAAVDSTTNVMEMMLTIWNKSEVGLIAALPRIVDSVWCKELGRRTDRRSSPMEQTPAA